jgi:hypothetical protein
MPRPKKIGLDYFPVDTVFDEKIQSLESLFGNDGLVWIIKFWQSAYRDEFGRVNLNKYFGEVMAKNTRSTTEVQQSIINFAKEIDLIKEIEPGIYTSNGIQKRINLVSRDRSEALKRYFKNKESTKEINTKKRRVKIKESKVKDFGHTSEKYPTIEEIRSYCLERNNKVDAEKWINHYQSNGWMVGKNKMKDWKACIRNWEKNEIANKPQQTGRPIYEYERNSASKYDNL